jgi:quercetin dioxygenase-like cupin family protein
MRILLASALLLASAAAASAQMAAAPAAPPPPSFDAPATPTTVYIAHRDFKPGESIGLHTHPGEEMTQVMAGDFDLIVEGKTTHYHAGESFMVPRGAKHDGKNVGTGTVTLAVTYVLDKGAPLRTAVP